MSAPPETTSPGEIPRSGQITAAATAFAALFAAVGIGLYGLTFFYDFFVKDYGWTRQQVTSGNAYSKLLIGPLFGYLAGYLIDRYGPRRLLLVGILMAGGAMIGLGYVSTLAGFYLCYIFNALGYVFGGPLPVQVLLSRWFTTARGKAMGFAYIGIGIGGTVVPGLAYWLTMNFGWHRAMQVLGCLMIAIAWPLAWIVKDAPPSFAADQASTAASAGTHRNLPALINRSAASCLILSFARFVKPSASTLPRRKHVRQRNRPRRRYIEAVDPWRHCNRHPPASLHQGKRQPRSFRSQHNRQPLRSRQRVQRRAARRAQRPWLDASCFERGDHRLAIARTRGRQ